MMEESPASGSRKVGRVAQAGEGTGEAVAPHRSATGQGAAAINALIDDSMGEPLAI